MSKNPHLVPRIKELLRRIYLADRQGKPSKARELLLKAMEAEGLTEKLGLGPEYPDISTVSKHLKKLRDKDAERSPELRALDEPWSLHSLPDYPVSTEALPVVMSLHEKCILESCGGITTEYWCLSIREALWIARLYKVVEFYYHKHMRRWADPDSAEELAELIQTYHVPANYREISLEDVILDWAYIMALEEESRELADEPDAGEERGEFMIGNVFREHGIRRREFIEEMANEYSIDDDKYQELQSMSMKDVCEFFYQLALEVYHERQH